jgi:hypothetical protein
MLKKAANGDDMDSDLNIPFVVIRFKNIQQQVTLRFILPITDTQGPLPWLTAESS